MIATGGYIIDVSTFTTKNLMPRRNLRKEELLPKKYARCEKVGWDAGFKWIGLNRKDKDGGGIGFLINNNIAKSCFVEPQTNDDN